MHLRKEMPRIDVGRQETISWRLDMRAGSFLWELWRKVLVQRTEALFVEVGVYQ